MKQLIRRFSRVADSSEYCLLRSDPRAAESRRRPGRTESFRCGLSKRYRRAAVVGIDGNPPSVPEGHVPVFVGEEMERFVVHAELLNHPVFVGLLNRSAQEYGYEQKGVLRIPCHVLVFERVMESLRLGGLVSRDLQDLLNSDEDYELF